MASNGDVLLEVYRALGDLTRATHDMREDLKDVKENQEEAKENRHAMGEQMRLMIARVDKLDKKIAEVKTITDEVQDWKKKGIGALSVVGIGASALTWLMDHWLGYLLSLLHIRIGQ